MLIFVWKWVYAHFINDPQIITELYFEHVDEINNALQCVTCSAVTPPEYATCPNCKSRGAELVWYPDIEEDGGDIAFELEPEAYVRLCDACGTEPRLDEPFWLSLYRTHHDDREEYGDCFSTDYLHDECLKKRCAADDAKGDGYGVQDCLPCPILDSEEHSLLQPEGWPQVGECFREYSSDPAECRKFENLEAEIEHRRILAENPDIAAGEEVIRQSAMRGMRGAA